MDLTEMETGPLLLQIGYGTVFVLLVAVTLGIAYLTAINWRDRRRRDNAEKGQRRTLTSRKRK